MKKLLLCLCCTWPFLGAEAQTRFEPEVRTNIGFISPRDGDNIKMSSSVDIIAGLRVNEKIRIGAGLGYEIGLFDFNSRNAYGSENAYAIPALLDLKINFSNSIISPFIDISGGYSFTISSDEHLDAKSGCRGTFSIGTDIDHWVCGVFYTARDWGDCEINQIIGVSVGVKF